LFPAAFFLLFAYSFLIVAHLSERGVHVIVFGDVGIVEGAVMLGHPQGTVSHELLEGKGIAAAVHEILAGEGVAEFVDGGAFYAAAFVIAGDGMTQPVFCEHLPVNIAEKIVLRPAFAYAHVLLQNVCHDAAKGDGLNPAVFVVPERHAHARKVYVTVLDVAHGSRTTAAVQQKIDDDPAAILPKVTVRIWTL